MPIIVLRFMHNLHLQRLWYYPKTQANFQVLSILLIYFLFNLATWKSKPREVLDLANWQTLCVLIQYFMVLAEFELHFALSYVSPLAI